MAWIGKWTVGIGVIHCTFGIVFMNEVLAVLWSEGVFNTVNGQPNREATFWFLYTGFLLILFGFMVDRLERSRLKIPTMVIVGFGLITIVGAVVMPISGIWLMLPPFIGMSLYNRRTRGDA